MRSDAFLALASELEPRIVAFMRDRLATMGVHDSGLYDFYAVRAGRGQAYSGFDLAFASFLVERACGFKRYLDVGAGLGQLSALLLKSGLNAIPIEYDFNRHRALQDMFALLELPDQAIFGRFPEAAGELLDPGSLVICSCVVGSDPNLEDDLIAGALKCGAAVVDLARFGRDRRTPEEHERLNEKLESAGLTCRERFWVHEEYHLAYYERSGP